MKPEDTICILNIISPRRRCERFKSILVPILQHVRHSSASVRVSPDEPLFGTSPGDATLKNGGTIPSYHDNKGILSTPAIAVMLFLQERGTNSVSDVQKYFKRYPWRLHHRIELNNKRSPSVKIAQQEFYALSREYPLWSLCPVYVGNEHLRLTLFVTRFCEMMEFYRLVTDTEMESTKPDFCLFPLSREDGDAHVLLCLKRSQHLKPFPLSRAYLTFKVRNIKIFTGLLKSDFKEVAPNRYLVNDPDGNRVILEDVTPRRSNRSNYENVGERIADVGCDVTSVKSTCGSQDSGRYSDSDVCPSDLDSKGKSKSVHFDDTDYERMWIYPRDSDSKSDDHGFRLGNVKVPLENGYNNETDNLDMCVDYLNGASPPGPHPGMGSPRDARAVCASPAGLDEPSNYESPRYRVQTAECIHNIQLPTVLVTDCSENVQTHTNNVFHPQPEVHCVYRGNSETVNHVSPTESDVLLSEEMYSHNYMFDHTDSVSSVPGNTDAIPLTPRNTHVSDKPRGDYSNQQTGSVNSSCCAVQNNSTDCDGKLREEVDRKRMVQPVYI